MFILTRAETPDAEALADRHQWPIRMTATYSADDAVAPVFVMQLAAPGEFSVDTFSCVASAQQMEDLPVDAPAEDGPFYRVNEITVMCRSADAALEFAAKVEYALQNLANNLYAATQLATVSEITITPDT